MSNESDEIDRGPPRRYLDKQEAIRHLVHSGIRLVSRRQSVWVHHRSGVPKPDWRSL
jgi:hypothetical protein